jgi:hypothetical protein
MGKHFFFAGAGRTFALYREKQFFYFRNFFLPGKLFFFAVWAECLFFAGGNSFFFAGARHAEDTRSYFLGGSRFAAAGVIF